MSDSKPFDVAELRRRFQWMALAQRTEDVIAMEDNIASEVQDLLADLARMTRIAADNIDAANRAGARAVALEGERDAWRAVADGLAEASRRCAGSDTTFTDVTAYWEALAAYDVLVQKGGAA